ncbi:hypothetical protein FACS1894200_13450 [Spirochaetia bacterium]|nr:hypothetical protein FACS1894200_13450 [Spirochaetia bacterium]
MENGRVLYSGLNGQKVYVDGNERSYVDEAQNRIVSPFEAEAAALTPMLPGLSATGSIAGGNAPTIQPTAPTIQPNTASGMGEVGIGGFESQ